MQPRDFIHFLKQLKVDYFIEDATNHERVYPGQVNLRQTNMEIDITGLNHDQINQLILYIENMIFKHNERLKVNIVIKHPEAQ